MDDDESEIGVVTGNDPRLPTRLQTAGIHTDMSTGLGRQVAAQGMDDTAEHRIEVLVPGVEAHLDGVAGTGDVALVECQPLSRRHALLHLDEADWLAAHARDAFGDGVLDLDTRVDFEKIRLALLVHQKLDGCRAPQLHRLTQALSIRTNALQGLPATAQAVDASGVGLGIEALYLLRDGLRVQGHFDKFLVAVILHRAVTRREVNDGLAVAEYLHLPVQRTRDVELDQHAFARVGLRRRDAHFRPHLGQRLADGVGRLQAAQFLDAEHPLALAAAAARMLEANGITGILRRHGERAARRFVGNGGLVRRTRKTDQRVVARDGRNIQLPGQRDGRVLVADGAQGVCRRADEAQPGRLDARGKVGTLCQEAVARIDGVNAVLLGNAQDGLDVIVFLHVMDVVGRQIGGPRRSAAPIGNPFLG